MVFLLVFNTYGGEGAAAATVAVATVAVATMAVATVAVVMSAAKAGGGEGGGEGGVEGGGGDQPRFCILSKAHPHLAANASHMHCLEILKD